MVLRKQSYGGTLVLTATCGVAGLSLTAEGQCSDHVVVGTRAGDCLFLDAAHGGQIMLCFPAHRHVQHRQSHQCQSATGFTANAVEPVHAATQMKVPTSDQLHFQSVNE